MTDQQPVLIEQIGSILRVQLNRPQKKNALNPEMYQGLIDAMDKADNNDGIQVLYITGTADSFSAGNDLKTFIQDTSSTVAQQFIKRISIAATPIVAAVNGLAIGVGVTMLLHCDLVYSVPTAMYNFAFIDLGLVPEAASSYLVPLLTGQRRAAELLMLGEKFDAQTAMDIGIVNRIINSPDFDREAWRFAEKLAAKSPEALRMTKHLLKRGNAAIVAETIDYELEMFYERLQSDEVKQVMQGILNRS